MFPVKFFALSCILLVTVVTFEDTPPKKPEFEKLWEAFPAGRHECPGLELHHQCAIRLSDALKSVGLALDNDYEGHKCNCDKKLARGAQDLGAWLVKKWGIRTFGFEKPGKMPENLRGKQGVILFMNIPDFSGQGHIDLWDGKRDESSATKGGAYWDAETIWFWELKSRSEN